MRNIKKASRIAFLVAILNLSFVLPGLAGAVGSITYKSFRICGTQGTCSVDVRGGEILCVYVADAGYSDIDLSVYDQFGRRVDTTNDNADGCLVRWIASYPGPYTIKVLNGCIDVVIVTN